VIGRRQLLLVLGGSVIAPRALRAQQQAIPVIGYLGSGSGPAGPGATAFRQGLSETGYVEGQNVAIEYRWAENRLDRLPALAADLVGRKVDVIVGETATALAARSATSTIPIIFVSGAPVEYGLVASLARPGGNLTGVSVLSVELVPKRLELLSELVPQAGVIALLVNPNNPNAEPMIRDVQAAARQRAPAPYPEGWHRRRDRHGLRLPPPTASRRARRRRRSVLQQPGAGAARDAGITPCRSSDL
jgi:putative tryptophan/tyrosine transport system substrate-binding protein